MSDHRMWTSWTKRLMRPIVSAALGEPVERLGDRLVHAGTARVPGAGNDLQLGVRPGPRHPPGRDQWAAEIELAVDEYAGDPTKCFGVAHQLAVVEEGVPAEVVRAEPGERDLEPRVLREPATGAAIGVERDEGVPPGAPLPRGGLPDGRVGVVEQPVVRRRDLATGCVGAAA